MKLEQINLIEAVPNLHFTELTPTAGFPNCRGLAADKWVTGSVDSGEILVGGPPDKNPRFFAKMGTVVQAGGDAEGYASLVQAPQVRGSVYMYKAKDLTLVAESTAEANTGFGSGGAWQGFTQEAPEKFELVGELKLAVKTGTE